MDSCLPLLVLNLPATLILKCFDLTAGGERGDSVLPMTEGRNLEHVNIVGVCVDS